MTGIAILLAAAAIGFAAARWSGLPSLPLLLLAGVGLALVGMVPEERLEGAVLLGVSFLVFVTGIELDLRRVGRQRGAALVVGSVQFLVLAGLGFFASVGLGFGASAALYLALAMAASSTLVVVRLLQQRQQMFEPFGRLVLGVLLVQDILVILSIPVLTGVPAGFGVAAAGLAGTLGLVGLAYVVARWVAPLLIVRLGLDEESILLVVVALLFVFVGLADVIGLPWITGAFLAGLSLSRFPVSGLVRGQLASLSDFFLAILFIALGALLVVPSIADLARGLALGALVVAVTPPLVTVMAERHGLSARPAIESGLLLSQTSEFSLVVGLQGILLGHVGADLFTIIAVVTVLTMMLTPFLATDRMSWRLLRYHPLRTLEPPPRRPPGNHIVLLGCGTNTVPLLETLVARGHDVVVVDDDPTVIAGLQEGGVPCVRGDGSERAVLEAAAASRAKLIISTMRRVADSEAVLDQLGTRVPVLVRVFDEAGAERIRRRGGRPVLYAEPAAAAFFRWFDGEVRGAPVR